MVAMVGLALFGGRENCYRPPCRMATEPLTRLRFQGQHYRWHARADCALVLEPWSGDYAAQCLLFLSAIRASTMSSHPES